MERAIAPVGPGDVLVRRPADAIPSERLRVEEIIELAGLSRVYGGIQYRFDIEAGRAIGKGAATLALQGSLE